MVTQAAAVNHASDVYAGQESNQPAAVKTTDVSKEAFLQLLVAQIRHQNPLNPADGVQFLTQLAEFSGLEQMMAIKEELVGIRQTLDQSATENVGDDTAAST